MSIPIRILHVFGKMNRGGAETFIMNVYRKIDREKIQFDFIVHTKEKCDYDSEIESMGGIIYRVPPFRLSNILSYANEFNNYFSKLPHRVVHCHIRSTASIILWIAKKNNKIGIAHSHSTSSGRGANAVIKNILQYPIRYIADFFMACSTEAGRWLFGKKVIKSNKYELWKNGIDPQDFIFNENHRKLIRKELGLETSVIIGHVGRLVSVKNHMLILEILPEVIKKNKDIHYLCIGDGELEMELRNKINELNLNNYVTILPSSSMVGKYYSAFDLFVLPSHFEGLGIVLIEAQTSGLMCLISDTVPKEAVLIQENVIRLSNMDKSRWIESIFHIIETNSIYSRNNYVERIKDTGYDISDVTEQLSKKYVKLSRE